MTWLSYGLWRLALAARRLTVPPTPSHAPFPWEVAKKCHSAGIPKSSSWWQRLIKFFYFCITPHNHQKNKWCTVVYQHFLLGILAAPFGRSALQLCHGCCFLIWQRNWNVTRLSHRRLQLSYNSTRMDEAWLEDYSVEWLGSILEDKAVILSEISNYKKLAWFNLSFVSQKNLPFPLLSVTWCWSPVVGLVHQGHLDSRT